MKPERKETKYPNVNCKTSGQDVDLVFGYIKGASIVHLNKCSGIDKCEIGINKCPHKNTTPVRISMADGTSFLELG